MKKDTRILMGMPITIELVDSVATDEMLNKVFAWFQHVDETFSPFKPTSEVSRYGAHDIDEKNVSADLRYILREAEATKQATNGYFNVYHDGHFNPSGIVKGWAIQRAAEQLQAAGLANFYVEAGGDIAVNGQNDAGTAWRIGIRNPFKPHEYVKVVQLSGQGIATSGTYIRGDHIYNPHTGRPANEVASLTVIGPNVYEADRFATAAFAMGLEGIHYIESLHGFEGYQIDPSGQATMTTGFAKYLPKS